MFLRNLKVLGKDGLLDIRVDGPIITSLELTRDQKTVPESSISFDHVLAFPGLINSHDHLDFNLFPRLGSRIYDNYTQWGKILHQENSQQIKAILRIPLETRIAWGMYKNLLNGFTTVVNHGKKLVIDNNFVRVIQQDQTIHSVQFDKNWKWKLNHPLRRNDPAVMHVGEGTDQASRDEIDRLIKWNFFGKPLIGVHGVAMQKHQARHFSALVWCPGSNFFLLNQTAAMDQLQTETNIIFGTDSTLTSGWNAWDDFRLARKTKMVSDQEFFAMLSTNAAKTWSLPLLGELAPGKQADIVIARESDMLSEWDNFFSLDPQELLLILREGRVRLFDQTLETQLPKDFLAGREFTPVRLGKTIKFVEGNLEQLLLTIKKFDPDLVLPIGPA